MEAEELIEADLGKPLVTAKQARFRHEQRVMEGGRDGWGRRNPGRQGRRSW
jgi:hypothetical protein